MTVRSPQPDPLPPGSTIGILGGGQLGRMLCLAAARLGYRTIVLDPDADAPAAQLASSFVNTDFQDPEGLRLLVSAAAVVTYEFENVPEQTVRDLAERVPVRPGLLALQKAQDRLVEKRFLNDVDIPTAQFVAVDRADAIDAAVDRLGGSALLKTRRLGYDGKGQVRLSAPAGDRALSVFDDLGRVPLIAEAIVAFEGELSVIGARDRYGGVICYPPARNVHRNGILATSRVPSGWEADLERLAWSLTASLLHALDYVGVLGLELFVLADGRLLANEFAPRVHNSGHWTEAACVVSQFEQHVRAVAGWPVVDPGTHSACEMSNLIGNDIDQIAAHLATPRTLVHLYGKSEVRPGRKMGHVTRLL